jgi:hypothetical protein
MISGTVNLATQTWERGCRESVGVTPGTISTTPIFFDLPICGGGKLFAGGMQPPIPFSPSYILLEISGFTGPSQEIRFL